MGGLVKVSTVLAMLLLGSCQSRGDTDQKVSETSDEDAKQMASAASDGDAGSMRIKPEACGGFSAADAEAVVGGPAYQWTRRVEKIHESLWSCDFATNDDDKHVTFSIEVAENAEDAAAQMEQYRSHLGDNYSDLMGWGDEGVWTEVNHTVTFRKQNVTIQVQQPPDKLQQLKVIKAIFDKN